MCTCRLRRIRFCFRLQFKTSICCQASISSLYSILIPVNMVHFTLFVQLLIALLSLSDLALNRICGSSFIWLSRQTDCSWSKVSFNLLYTFIVIIIGQTTLFLFCIGSEMIILFYNIAPDRIQIKKVNKQLKGPFRNAQILISLQ